jgi:hypothetical protein
MTINNKNPNKFLQCAVLYLEGTEVWPYVSDDPWYQNQNYYKWRVDISVTAQTHSSPYTREQYTYNGIDISVGDWIAGGSPTRALKVVQILDKTETTASLIIEDVERFNTFYDLTLNGNGVFGYDVVYIFEMADDGMPIVFPISFGVSIDPYFSNDLISRFRINNPNFRYRLYRTTHPFVVGDEIYLDTVSQTYELLIPGKYPLGRVVDTSDSIDTFLIKPVNKIQEGIDPPLPGSRGDVIYYSDSSPGDLTTTVSDRAAYIKIDNTTGMVIETGIDEVGGVTVYPTLAARPTTAQVGQMAYVTDAYADTGRNEWALYIWTIGGWVPVSTQDSAATDARSLEKTVSFDSTGSPIEIGKLSNGRKVTQVMVDVLTAFNGTNPTLSVGDVNDPAVLIDNSLIDLKSVGAYGVTSDFIYKDGPDTSILITFNFDSSTTGSANVIITYV